ncbi:maltase-glucoamylase-like [Saccostrea echinata]|uniref:maltase-glucoamylase-like n=1 Tax=Saccostrea echinata TaxID=191078 RepID=UPI002A7F5E54|nr:maltase-glucoamylase-like [Saccostrea echinata]
MAKRCSKERVGITFLIIVVLACIITPIVYLIQKPDKRKDGPIISPTQAPVPAIPSELHQRIDCLPEAQGNFVKLTKEKCEQRNCVFVQEQSTTSCVYPANSDYGYSIVQESVTAYKSIFYLRKRGKSPFNGRSLDFVEPIVEVEEHGDDLLRIKFDDAKTNRYEVPLHISTPPKRAKNPKYEFKIVDKEKFAFKLIRKSTGAVLLDTSVGGLSLTDQFLQFSTRLPSFNVYGFGENVHQSFKHNMSNQQWPMFSRDQGTPGIHHFNLYGVHPFYTCVEEDGNTHGVLLLNSNAQDYAFTPLPMLTYRTIGGVLDFYVFLGPKPENVIQQYTKAIGRPFLPPYWSLGFQLCRYGYNNLETMKKAVERTRNASIPLDVQYADIDHMDEQKDFTIDPVNFKGLKEYFDELRSEGMRTIIILDPALLSTDPLYEPYKKLSDVSGGVMWRDAPGDEKYKDPTGALLGYVWPNGKAVFPDFFKPATQNVWKELIQGHRQNKLVMDGLWIDMNEPANFGTNEEKPWNYPPNTTPWSLHCPDSPLEDPPYRTKAAFVHDRDDKEIRLSDKTICMTSRQGEHNELLHYNVHSLYGWSQTKPTLDAIREATGERSVVITRSTYPGSGKYGGHWLGDNDSSWLSMRNSIIGMLEFNLFGIPYIGADICGFFGNTTGELCLRWMQLGAFYPFSRNHNGKDNIEQDPAVLGEHVTKASREALETRYHLLPYLYTLFYFAHAHGNTVVRPLHHEFTNDKYTLEISEQFLWGSSLLISPILYQNTSTITYYLPDGKWYDYYSGNPTQSTGRNFTQNIQLDSKILLNVRGGSIIPQQTPSTTTTESRKNPLTLLVALDEEGRTRGSLFWDDGVSIETIENNNFLLASMAVEQSELKYRVEEGNPKAIEDGVIIDKIEIWGVQGDVTLVLKDSTQQLTNFTKMGHILTIYNLSHPLSEEFDIKWMSGSYDDLLRIDCFPERLGKHEKLTKEKCEQRNCTYSTTPSEAPDCFFPMADYGYSISGPVNKTDYGWHVPLKRKGSPPFKDPIDDLVFEIEHYGDSVFRFKLDVPSKDRYTVPLNMEIFPHKHSDEPRYELIITNNDTFAFQIIRRSSRAVIWDTGVGGLTFENQFLQIATKLPSRNVYGFGENVHGKFRHDVNWKQWPMFSRDEGTGNQNFNNHYGVHPFYMCMEEDGQAHGVLLLNSNAQDYAFTPLPMLIYRTIGGILDFYVFMGPEPENVVQQYHTAIGKPYLPPYWSLGFQLCRYGYNTIEKMQEAVNRTRKANIPHDVQYADIDHMYKQMDFTIDHKRFPGLNAYFKNLQQQGMKTIIILDPTLISNVSGYEPYEKMKAARGSIMWPKNYSIPLDSSDSGALLGYVWPEGKVIFPDFFKNETQRVWEELVKNHHNNLTFDGLWIDMNEPANFGTNEEKPWNWPDGARPYWSLKCKEGEDLEDPPYRTMAAFVYDKVDKKIRISDKTICMVAKQGNAEEYNHYDVHSLYGWSQTPTTLRGLRQATNKRGIVISRSTFPGSGKYAGHWLGDNSAVWPDVHLSIIGSLEFNLFGIPYIGADICGFFGNSTSQLCKRWMQLGAFYTFSRNHNGIGYIPQDPAYLGEDVAEASRVALETRYSLLPYLYTLFYKSHTKGGTVMRPLHHEFPRDKMTYDIDSQFLWGPGLLISPILYEDQTTLSLYLPPGTWYDFYTGKHYLGGQRLSLDVDGDSKISLHVRGGCIIPRQDPALTTKDSRLTPFTLVVALDDDGRRQTANGELFWDDGESIDTLKSSSYYHTKFQYSNDILGMTVQKKNNALVQNLTVETVIILGLNEKIKYAYVQGINSHFNVEGDTMKIVKNLRRTLKEDFVIEFREELKPTEDEASRVDCLPDVSGDENLNKLTCEKRGCIWQKAENKISVPACFIDNNKYGYAFESIEGNKTINLRWRSQSSMFEGDLHKIKLSIHEISESIVQLKFDDPSSSRYEVPVHLNKLNESPKKNKKYRIEYANTNSSMFYFKVIRQDTNKTIFDTSIGGFTFADQFLQLVTILPSEYVYGFGENRHFTFKHNMNFKKWPMFSRDNGVNWGDYANLYGVHPFYMCVEDDQGNSNGVLLLNSNAMEVVFSPRPSITYRTVGGILDFYIFMGPTPENVIQQYTELIGRPYLPPYWALGFQLSRYGYNNLDNLKAATKRMIDNRIPLDVQYADIDHMDERKDFTVDEVNFKNLSGYVKELDSKDIHFIIILDPALISNETNYNPYELGKNGSLFIKWPYFNDSRNGTDMLGYVWPKGKVVFPDFLKNETREYWKKLIVEHHNKLPFDGLWIDMNEPANFGTNEERPFNWPEKDKPYWSLKCPHSALDDPPYKPRGVFGPRLSDKTLCMVALQNDGAYNHYDVHSLYGWSETEPTLYGLRESKNQTKRGIVISRSTYPSSGKYAGHWLGDNDSKWPDVHDSIIGILEFNLFGIPYIGSDICGFFGHPSAELCERWMQLGAFYTFSRNHNTINMKDQDPAIFGPAIADSSRRVLNLRYSLLPYLYTLFYEVHTNGGTVIRSLMQNFPQDLKSRSIDTQFMWGSAIMVSPVLSTGKIEVEVYFPEGRWFDFKTGELVSQQGKEILTVSAPRDEIPVFVLGGSIIPTQHPGVNTKVSRLNLMEIIVVPDKNGDAEGSLFLDDGESINTVERGQIYLSTFTFNNTYFTLKVQSHNDTVSNIKIGSIVVYGMKRQIYSVKINNTDTDFEFRKPHNTLHINSSISIKDDIYIQLS